jgi:tetratricopeptide (TPR) repeat protein
MMARMLHVHRWTLAAAALVLLAACERRPELLPVPAPQIAAFEASVCVAIERAQGEVDKAAGAGTNNAQLAHAYGQLAMTYHAHQQFAAAEAAYRNAQRLAPKEQRWPYLLGQAYNDSARPEQAFAAFEQALALGPTDKAALHALGQAALQRGELDKAQAAFEKLLDARESRAAGLAGLGFIALARNDSRGAVVRFEEALQLAPGAARLRQPLAMAWRAAGDAAKAEAALRGFSPDAPEPGVPDPLARALADKAATTAALVQRGQRYGREGKFELAAQAFEAAAQSNPNDAATQANLGISLANLGQLDKAEAALRRALGLGANDPAAQFSLAVVCDRQGRDDDARTLYRALLTRDPNQHQARLYLADATLRTGDAPGAVLLYSEAMALQPTPRTRLSLAFALIKAGRLGQAKAQLEQGLAADPRDVGMGNALVRLLAAAPEAALRDGARARTLGREWFEATRSAEVGESYAMALAEAGEFELARKLQREALLAHDKAQRPHAKALAERNLVLYEQSKPTREPWAPQDIVFQPRSPAVSRVR